MSWTHGSYGLAPSRAALGMHALACLHALGGLWYPEGGGQTIVDALVDVIQRHGGVVRVDTQVSQILLDHGAVTGVRLAAGGSAPAVDELRAPVVVAAGDLKRTVFELLGSKALPARVRRRVGKYEMAAAALFVVSLVIDRDLRAEGMRNAAWWGAIDCDDIDSMYACLRHGQMPSQQWTEVFSPSLKDPTNPNLCRPGQTNLRLMTFAPASHEFWDMGPGLSPGPGYEPRQRELRNRVVHHAERVIPGLAGAIVDEHIATPITQERHFGSTGGTPYGIAATPSQFGLRRPGPRTAIKGLYLAGASTRSLHGITGSMLGGTEAARMIAGVRALEAI